jgi:fructose-bisphosphate aldolase class I
VNAQAELAATAQALVAAGKGLLAADESFPTIGKRFAALHIPDTADTRRAYREMLFTTPGLNRFISGVILFDETLHQTIGGEPVPVFLAQQGLIPGIKVDAGAVDMPGHPGEKITQGFEGLRERLDAYRKLGARFTKWRAVMAVGEKLPTSAALTANAHALALFASLSQEAGLVPIVEPEVLMDGNHTLARCADVTRDTLNTVFEALAAHQVDLEGMLLKTGMVLPGADCPEQADAKAIATATLRILIETVPAAVPGVVFLSGGQGDIDATARLNAISQAGGMPWKLTFSYGRALQDAAMKTWAGASANVPAAQAALENRARCNSLAARGKYSAGAENAAA